MRAALAVKETEISVKQATVDAMKAVIGGWKRAPAGCDAGAFSHNKQQLKRKRITVGEIKKEIISNEVELGNQGAELREEKRRLHKIDDVIRAMMMKSILGNGRHHCSEKPATSSQSPLAVITTDALKVIQWDGANKKPLLDVSFRSPFTGRSDLFWETTKHLFDLHGMQPRVDNPPTRHTRTQTLQTRALALATCSGAGKTVGFLQLKQFFNDIVNGKAISGFEGWANGKGIGKDKVPTRQTLVDFVKASNPVVVYCGFGATLPLSPIDESPLINNKNKKKEKGLLDADDGIARVILRRLVVMAAFSLMNPTKITAMPDYAIFDAVSQFPAPNDLVRVLGELLATNGRRSDDAAASPPPILRTVVACVDEVQKLDEEFGVPNLGRKMVRVLRDLQLPLRNAGILLVPMAVGITSNFAETLDEDNNDTKDDRRGVSGAYIPLHGGDPVLLAKRDYERLALDVVPALKAQGRFTHIKSNNINKDAMVARILRVALWPNVRFLKIVAEAEGRMETALESQRDDDSNKKYRRALFFVYQQYLLGETVTAAELAKAMKGVGQVLPFEVVSAKQCRLVPSALISSMLRQAMILSVREIAQNKDLKRLFTDLPVLSGSLSTFEETLIPTDYGPAFEKRSFAVFGCAMHIGLLICAQGYDNQPLLPTSLLGGCVEWVWNTLQNLGCTKMKKKPNHLDMLKRVKRFAQPDTELFPFDYDAPSLKTEKVTQTKKKSHNSDEETKAAVFVEEVAAAVARRVPLYVRGGPKSPADFYFLFPVASSKANGAGERRWIAVVAKHTTTNNNNNTNKSKSEHSDDLLQLEGACECLALALAAAGHHLVASRMVYVTNRRTATMQINDKILVITARNYNFPPFSDLLFIADHDDVADD